MTATIPDKPKKPKGDKAQLAINTARAIEMAANASASRTNLLNGLLGDPSRDINEACHYPNEPTMEDYTYLFERMGIAQRVVGLEPEDTWGMDPSVEENEDPEDTEFEEEWKNLQEKHNLYHYLHRIDELSGIGRFGVLLFGLNDGGGLETPVPGISETGVIDPVGNERELIYVRVFDESMVTVKTRQDDVTNPRYGKPIMYTINFQEVSALTDADTAAAGAASGSVKTNEKLVHWSRLLHVADNRKTSEVYGTPRMKPVFNRLLDIRKVLSGSGEMFWKGAFPGYSFEVSPAAQEAGATLDVDSLREEMTAYENGLQRYLALTGVSAHSLAPQISDPSAHMKAFYDFIAITLSIPSRIFQGSEQAKLASTEDVDTWNKRIKKRQLKYVSPMILRPFIDRLTAFSIIPKPDEYVISWPDLSTPSEAALAEVAVKKTEAMAKYVAAGVDQLMPPEMYLDMVMGLSSDEIDVIIDAATERMEEEAAELAAAEALGIGPDGQPINPPAPNNPPGDES